MRPTRRAARAARAGLLPGVRRRSLRAQRHRSGTDTVHARRRRLPRGLRVRRGRWVRRETKLRQPAPRLRRSLRRPPHRREELRGLWSRVHRQRGVLREPVCRPSAPTPATAADAASPASPERRAAPAPAAAASARPRAATDAPRSTTTSTAARARRPALASRRARRRPACASRRASARRAQAWRASTC